MSPFYHFIRLTPKPANVISPRPHINIGEVFFMRSR